MKRLIVEKDNLIFNYKLLSDICGTEVIPVLKANAYGFGRNELAEIFLQCGAKIIAVSAAEDATELAKAELGAEILLLSPCYDSDLIKEMIELSVIATVDSIEAAMLLNAQAKEAEKTAKIHIKVDTGFGRYGFLADEVQKVVEIAAMENIEITGAFSHLSLSFMPKKKTTKTQYDRFIAFIEKLKSEGVEISFLHLANSSAALNFPYTRLSAVRIGSALIGRISGGSTCGLKSCSYLECSINAIKNLPKGHNVGYGNTYKTKRDTKIAVLDVGTNDGVFLQRMQDSFRFMDMARNIFHIILAFLYKKRVYAEIAGKRAKVIGRYNAANIVLDVTDIDCKVGDIAKFNVNPLFIDSGIERVYI